MSNAKIVHRYHRVQLNKVVRRVVGDRGRIIRFRDLPREAKYAIIYYMAVNGEAWPDVTDKIYETAYYDFYNGFWKSAKNDKKIVAARVLDSVMQYVDVKYGDCPFGYAVVPMDSLIRSVMEDDAQGEFGSFDEAHANYVRSNQLPRHPSTNRWPVILSSQDAHGETLQDGWHRFHSYYESGHVDVPVVYYVASPASYRRP